MGVQWTVGIKLDPCTSPGSATQNEDFVYSCLFLEKNTS